ncbi:MAG: GC-type dockerin domain-anchored protein [Phycisphaerales bacterium]
MKRDSSDRALVWAHVAAGMAMCLAAGAAGQTAHFASPTDTIRLTGDTTFGSAFTMEAVVMREAFAGTASRIFSEQMDSQEDKSLAASGGGTGGGAWTGGCDASAAGANVALPVGEWKHIAMVRDGTVYRLFIDGVMVQENPATCATRNGNGGNMAIGGFPYTLQTFVDPGFVGYIDWVRVSSVARYTTSFVPPACEPASDVDTLVLLTMNDAPGTMSVAVSGTAVSGAVAGQGFAGATSPVFGPGPQARTPVIVSAPASAATCPSANAVFGVVATGAGPLSYRWEIETSTNVWSGLGNDPFPLPCGGGAFAFASQPSAASTPIGVHACAGVSNYRIRCVVSNACGSTTSDPAMLHIGCSSRADVARLGGLPGCDGQLTADDVVYYLAQFFANNAAVADLVGLGGGGGPDGLITVDDLVAFLAAFFAGC